MRGEPRLAELVNALSQPVQREGDLAAQRAGQVGRQDEGLAQHQTPLQERIDAVDVDVAQGLAEQAERFKQEGSQLYKKV